ncbi:alpha/beta fold hydrolase [Chitinasiproducens palmae]|uniref:Pimeloyl-ACP methyl ester carboxylesterase n=1 Tax=Chitinasiproducens palmae TaxID=1770053 RepID=A0A1H2PS01_9BURK|nr:alpha/beta hydrolase [Chitinasiproducens palmae]SDV49722.1 Pimeloyl-ACP methyl ester carboxylesterase [Chitinasiproducens palmae]
MNDAREGYIELDGDAFWYEEAGAGPALVLLHGFSFDAACWDLQFPHWAAQRRVIRYELRGFGRSTRRARETGAASALPAHVQDLFELCAALGVARADLVGVSLGANVALAAALARPEFVRSLSLVSPGLPGHRWTTPRPPDEAAAHARARGVAAAKRYWFGHPIFEAARARPVARALLAEMIERYDGWQWTHDGAAPLPPIEARLGEVRAPALIVGGARDCDGYREIAAALGDGISGAERVTIEAAGHVPNLEVPDTFNELIDAFLARVDAAAASTAPP